MTTSSNEQRRGSQPAKRNTTLEAPPLRLAMLPTAATEDLSSPCPTWCRWHGEGHPVNQPLTRRHQSEPLRVRQECGARVLEHYDEKTDSFVTAFAHLEIRLTRGQHSEKRFGIEMTENFQHEGKLQARRIVPLHEFEVVELISALQHLMRVGAQE